MDLLYPVGVISSALNREAKPSLVAIKTSFEVVSFLVQFKESSLPREMIIKPREEMDSNAFKGVFLTNPWEVKRTKYSSAPNLLTGIIEVI